MRIRRRRGAALLLAALLAACGGGGGGSPAPPDGPPSGAARRELTSIGSRTTGTAYGLNVYLPPAAAGPRGSLPLVVALDGETWFETLVGAVESGGTPAIVVALHGAGQRNRDYVPANACTPGGGGHAAFLDFVINELLPMVESTYGGNPRQRVLFGHSHGGSFVFHALFAQPPGSHAFAAYLASDSSVSCMPVAAADWEQRYAAAYRELPVRLQVSYASLGNAAPNQAYAGVIAGRGYMRLTLADQLYAGTHGGIVPMVLADGLRFALAR